MDYRKAQGVTNKLHSFLAWATLGSILAAVLLALSHAIAPAIVFVIFAGLSAKGASAAGYRTRRYFDLANIQGLIKAEGMTTSQRRRMAMRIYKTNK